MRTKISRNTLLLLSVVFLAAIASAAFIMIKGKHHTGNMHARMHGSDGTGHDEINMPGLKGENATVEESAELAVLFRQFDTITREVENLANGIKTTTRSSDASVMSNLVSHVIGMIDRVEKKNDPKILIQSPTLDIFFLRGEQIQSDVEVTDSGIVVTQISQDPKMVTALQEHAAEVTAMADRGMQAMHEMMMERGNSH